MRNQKETLRKIVSLLNNPEADGGFWLPNIQRPFVWSEEQICRLFDSILRQYPISTLLIWKTTSALKRRKFIDNWAPSLRLDDFYVPNDDRPKCLVLDGQQRLQSLFIALSGSYEGKELYFDILSGEIAAPDDVKFKFDFRHAKEAGFPWIKFKDLVHSNKLTGQLARQVESTAKRRLADNERDKIELHLDLVAKTFKMDQVITYQELDGIDNPELYSEDDVVEVFIRANSGGTRLGKSDLLFSLLAASWDEADARMSELLEDLNRRGFDFTRDFVLKTSLVLLGQGARYEVEKLRKKENKERIEKEWDQISAAIRDVLDFVCGKTFIRCDKALPSYLALIPLVYLRFHYPHQWHSTRGMDTYLLRVLLAGAFGASPDALLDALVAGIQEARSFALDSAFETIRSRGRSLELTDGKLWQMGYGSDNVYLLFNHWYRQFNFTPAYQNNLPQIDHIFPQSALRKVKVESPRTGKRSIVKYGQQERDQLANCMLLSREENGGGGKSDTLPSQWFSGRSPEYLAMHLIPQDPALWALERFEDFLSARKVLIREKMADLLSQVGAVADARDQATRETADV